MDFLNFCAAHGIIINHAPPIGIWRRYPTTDHPKSRNGAVKFMGAMVTVDRNKPLPCVLRPQSSVALVFLSSFFLTAL